MRMLLCDDAVIILRECKSSSGAIFIAAVSFFSGTKSFFTSTEYSVSMSMVDFRYCVLGLMPEF